MSERLFDLRELHRAGLWSLSKDEIQPPHFVGVRRGAQLYVLKRFDAVHRGAFQGEVPPKVGSFPPVVVPDHPVVNRFLTAYVTTNRFELERLLERREQYRSRLEPLFTDLGLPPELINVALLESGFDPNTRSPRGAVGMWQLVSSTARNYGLKVSALRDERKDIDKSTQVAARHFVDLYAQFSDWKLAVAAYNCGPFGLQRAVETGGTRDIFALADKGLVSKETSEFVARFLALTKISNNPEAFGVHSVHHISKDY